MPYIPHTEKEVQAMLQVIGVPDIEHLFDEIPSELRVSALPGVPPGVGEQEITQIMQGRAEEDGQPVCFLGAGAYDHFIPAAVWQLVSRGEFYSAYTPYQAEASQGTLQLLYEYQSMMCHLTGMEVANASLYDGASALAEAALMAVRVHRKTSAPKILIPRAVHPNYRRVLQNIIGQQGISVEELPFDPRGGHTLPARTETGEVTALVISQPNFFGMLEEVDELCDWAHAQGAVVIGLVNPLATSVLKPPGEWGEKGADIVCGEGQPLGLPLSSGGPNVGFLCSRKAYVRQMPGRIVGRTVDTEGKTGYTLTLQAREQHIRRSKATSNICTNQGLLVTASTIHMAIMGPQGVMDAATESHARTLMLVEKLSEIPGVRACFNRPFFHEAVLCLDTSADELITTLAAHNLLAGYSLQEHYPELGNALLVCATEKRTEAEITQFADHLKRYMQLRTSAACPVQPKM